MTIYILVYREVECVSAVEKERERKADGERERESERGKRWILQESRFLDSVLFWTIFLLTILRFPRQQPLLPS